MTIESNFNSRPCARGDLEYIVSVSEDEHISIPAPARGATIIASIGELGVYHFNSRPCARGDSYFPVNYFPVK